LTLAINRRAHDYGGCKFSMTLMLLADSGKDESGHG